MNVADHLRLVDLDRDPGGAPFASGAVPIMIGLARGRLDDRARAIVPSLDLTLTAGEPDSIAEIQVADIDQAVAELAAAVAANPLAATTLCGLLRSTETAAVADALVVESLAYSMLLAGPEFARWRAGRARRAIPSTEAPAVLLTRDEDILHITLNRPERRNAFGVAIRDGLVDAFDLAGLDDTIRSVHLAGAGAAFCSGGDLDEFGSTPDVATAHLIRLDRSVARRVDAVRGRVTVHLHGACVGAGIELPSFAGRVLARPDTVIVLPEVAMGLLPGAGGTVGIPRRIGRWRTAYLALSGTRLAARTAAEWGLVDEVEDG
jgi:enoyl-CoA hydratase/carnithine racemase